jgi:hypothetical protein
MAVKITTLSENAVAIPDVLAEWGFSVLIEIDGMTLLLDAGASNTVIHNAGMLGIDLKKVDRIILSHGHYDHTGGLQNVLRAMRKKIEIVAHPDVWAEKYARRDDGAYRYVGIPFQRQVLESLGASFTLAKEFLATGRLTNPLSWEADMEACTRKEALARGWSGVWFSSEWGIHNMIPDLLNSPHGSIIDDTPEELFTERNSLQVFQDRLDREWGLMRGEPTCLGGAYFPWISSSAGAGPEGNPWGWMRHGEDADWGVVCGDLTTKPFFWAMRVAYSPVRFPRRLAWQKGQRDINFELENQYNRIDLSQCALRAQFAHAGKWMTMLRQFTDVPVACPPGGRVTVRLALPDAQWLEHLDGGKSIMVRCTLLDPRGFKATTAEILVLSGDAVRAGDQLMPIGPDAVM